MTRISNMNNISVRTYGEKGETLAVIRELKKLGIIKSKKERKPKTMTDLKQESDMVGYVKTLAEQAAQGKPNIFSLRQIEPSMSEQQIRDIRERNNAGVAALRAEIQQQRLEDIEQQQGQRFADITRLGGIMNPILERFRGAQEPGAGQIVDPFKQSSTILLPDIQEGEEAFTQTLNEGGPRAEPQVQTELFAEDEDEEEFVLPIRPQLQPREKVGGGGASRSSSRSTTRETLQEISNRLDLGKVPKRNAKLFEIRDYYIRLTDATGTPEVLDYNKEEFYNEIENILARTGFK